MRALGVDTATGIASVGLVSDDTAVVRQQPMATSHARTLLPLVDAVLVAAGTDLREVDLLAVSIGPGSFTGLRIGIASIQGLALVSKRRVVGVSALEAHAHLASRELDAGALVACWIDAQRGEVFSALYRVADAPLFTPERLVELAGPAVADPALTLAEWSEHHTASATFVGDGAVRYLAGAGMNSPMAATVPIAGAIGCMAAVSAQRGLATPPAAVHALYVRRPDAELLRGKARQR